MSIYQNRKPNCGRHPSASVDYGGIEAGGEIVADGGRIVAASVDAACIQGPKGDKGDPGEPPNISANAKTLPAGSAAIVERSGTNLEPIFTFGIPKGDRGEKGEQGAPGSAGVSTVEDSFIANLF